MHNKFFKFGICFLFAGITVSESSVKRDSAPSSRGSKRMQNQNTAFFNQNDSDSSAAFANAKNMAINMHPSSDIMKSFLNTHVSTNHIGSIDSGLQTYNIAKLLTSTHEGYIYHHTKTVDKVTNTESIKSLNPSELANYNGGPLTDTAKRDEVRSAYEDLVTHVVNGKTSDDFKLLIASTGGTNDGNPLNDSNSHQKLLEEHLNKTLVKIGTVEYKGLEALASIENQLKTQNLSPEDFSRLSNIATELGTALATSATRYHSQNDSRGNPFGSAADDVYLNHSSYTDYLNAFENHPDTQNVRNMADNIVLHDLTNTTGLTNAFDKSMEHFKSTDLENHALPYSGHTQLDGDAKDELRNGLKTFYENIPLTYEGIKSAINVTGGSEHGTAESSHKSILEISLNTHLKELEKINTQLQTETDPSTIQSLKHQQETIAKASHAILMNYADAHASGGITNVASNDAYLDYSAAKQMIAEREEQYPSHFQEGKVITHESTTGTAHHSSVVNAKIKQNEQN